MIKYKFFGGKVIACRLEGFSLKSERKVVVTTPLRAGVLEELKRKSGETTTKKALVKAVEHYLECPRSPVES